MEALNLIGWLDNYCKENNIYFCPGEESFANFLSDKKIYKAYDLILCCDLYLSPRYNENGIVDVVYRGKLSLGRKKEECTQATMDELFKQKYDRRLKDLTELIVNILNELVCSEEVEMLSNDIRYVINQYDANIDFVSANVNLAVQYNE